MSELTHRVTSLILVGLAAACGDPDGAASGSADAGDDVGGDAELGLGDIVWRTNRVLLTARDFAIEAGGVTFLGRGSGVDVKVDGDPGDESYETLELTWHEHGVEMRWFIYFESDGVEWWSNEQRIYDGTTPGEWIEPRFEVEQFRSPIGEAFEGDLFLETPPAAAIPGRLRIQHMYLQAFLAPSCDGSPVFLEPKVPVVEIPFYPEYTISGGQSFWFRDAACDEIPFADFELTWTVADPDIVRLEAFVDEERGPYAEIDPLRLGETTVVVEATRDGDVVAEQSFPVVVYDP